MIAAMILRLAMGVMMALLALPVGAQDHVSFASLDADLTRAAPTMLTARLQRPTGDGPFAAVVLLHGCGGLTTARGALTARHLQWTDRLVESGFAVLLVDSFNPRGRSEVCTQSDRTIRSGIERVRDAHAARAYLQARSFIRPDRIALMGWSHGAGTTLSAIASDLRLPRAAQVSGPPLRAAVAFYPGCRLFSERGWTTPTPSLILVGELDDWTPSAPCIEAASAAAARGAPVEHVVYPGAYHDFDAPGLAIRVRTGLAIPGGGTRATLGTNEPARLDALDRVPGFLHRHLD